MAMALSLESKSVSTHFASFPDSCLLLLLALHSFLASRVGEHKFSIGLRFTPVRPPAV